MSFAIPDAGVRQRLASTFPNVIAPEGELPPEGLMLRCFTFGHVHLPANVRP